MRAAYAHEAMLVMEPDADLRAPGAAITAELCGHWEHEPPCPLAAHYTNAYRVGEQVRIRTLFASEPADEAEVRRRIDTALGRGRLDHTAGPPGSNDSAGSAGSDREEGEGSPDAVVTRWRLESSGPAPVSPDEADHAARLAETSAAEN